MDLRIAPRTHTYSGLLSFLQNNISFQSVISLPEIVFALYNPDLVYCTQIDDNFVSFFSDFHELDQLKTLYRILESVPSHQLLINLAVVVF